MIVTLGPLALPAQLLVAFATIILGSAIGNRVAARHGVKTESSLWLIIAGAILVARIVFVARYWPLYAEEPWRLPDLRDGGLAPVAGFAAAVIIGAILAWRKADQRAAIVIAVWSGLVIWIAGNGLVRMATERQALPEVMLTDLDGRAVPLTAFAGKPMVVNLWASWCPPCRREMPALGKAQREASDLSFVFVNQGEDRATVRAYLKAEGLPLRNVVLDPGGALAKAAGAPGLPTTLFVDANGILVDKRMGEVSSATLAEHLAVLRSKRSTANAR
jgi:thiol-disulfide isomerase/thioredoxin